MMKHESMAKPLNIGSGAVLGGPTAGDSHTLKRGLWRNRSTSEAPCVTRGPITKAFDFLSWNKSKKTDKSSVTSQNTKANSKLEVGGETKNSPPRDPSEPIEANKKDSAVHYHRNIFRNGGGLIRDILGDKLNKEKVLTKEITNSATLPNKKSLRRKAKQVVSRNKSLDINELIDCVESELAAAETQQNGRSRFLDDTFIENILRAKELYHKNLDHDEEDFYALQNDEVDPGEQTHHEQALEKQKDESITEPKPISNLRQTNSNQTSTNSSSSPTQTTGNASPKHILFNDENTVYIIKKEQPVKREAHKFLSGSKKSSSTNTPSESVLKARLKLKKVTTAQTILNNNHVITNNTVQQPNYPNSQSRNFQSQMSSQMESNSSLKHRSILQRQNTAPSPESLRRSHQLYYRSEHRNQIQRRKSLTNYDNTHYTQHDNLSSSSGGSLNGIPTSNSIALERPKTDKPRKKLSFREPVVSDKESAKSRRCSSPNYGPPPNGSHNTNNLNSNNKINNNNNSNLICDNSYKTLNPTRYLNGTTNNLVLESNNYNQITDPDESQAMRIVRTVGQAFEVCHKFNLHKNSLEPNDERSDVSSELLDVEQISEQQLSDEDTNKNKDHLATTPDIGHPTQRPNHLKLVPQTLILKNDEDKSPTTPSSPSREINKLKDQLEQQALQTRQALAQLMLVREQLISETNARIEAQARTQQLLQQNRELLEHLASLGAYTEQQTTGLTSANIAMAPQSQLQMLLQATSNNNNLATINQQISNLGNINQQLTSLSHQLSGLNQQSQNLQNLQNLNANLQQQSQQQQPGATTPNTQMQSLAAPSTSGMHQSQMHLNVSAANVANSNSTGNLSTSPFPSMNHLQAISGQLQQLNSQQHQQQQQQQQDVLNKDLFQMNQELLSRLQALNLGATASTSAAMTLSPSPLPSHNPPQQNPSPHNSFFYVNPMSCTPSNNNNSASNFNFLSSPNSMGNLTPSPIGTLNRNSFTNSPINEDALRLSIEKNLNSLDEQLRKSMGHITNSVSNGNIASSTSTAAAVSIAASSSTTGTRENSRSSSTIDSPLTSLGRGSLNSNHMNNNSSLSMNNMNNNGNEPRFNTVTLKVTDESGNVTNQRKLSATPSFITRSTSEKLSSTAKVARWFQQLPWNTTSLSRPESGFVSGDSRSEKYHEEHYYSAKETDDLCDEFLLVEGSSTIWTKLSARKRRKLLGLRLGKVTTF